MSTKVVAFQRNPNDHARVNAIQTNLAPLATVYYNEHGPIAPFPNLKGQLDYLLFTGGHGNFRDAAPTQMNGLSVAAVREWAATIASEFDAIILDTCFSSSFIPIFSPHVRIGGAIVCAHGSGEGFTDALVNPANSGRSVGAALSGLADGISGLGLSFTSLSLYVRSARGLRLYTTNGGAQRSDGLAARGNYGMDADSADELGQLDRFLIGRLVAVEVVTLADLQVKLANHLDMVI